ncbi:MAG: glutamine amidotransferase [Thermoguttaceae bacterium]
MSKICYLGDGRLSGAAGYLAAVMQHHGLPLDHVPSDEPPPATFGRRQYALYVVSDYPAARFGAAAMAHVAGRVARGAGLLMLGGWESYFGRSGEYHQSPLAEVLPVVMQTADDRCNYAQPCLIRQVAEHPILKGLPWDAPPGIGGRNLVGPKPDARTLLTSVPFVVRRTKRGWQFFHDEESPLLVVGRHGRGRTAALATDVAPHWVGGLVDWGDRRVAQNVAGELFEVGNWYARFFHNLLAWTGRLRP